MGGRDVQLCVVGVLYREYFASFAVDHNLRRTYESADAVVDVDDVFPRFELVKVVDARAGFCARRGAADAGGFLLCEYTIGFCDYRKAAESAFRAQLESAARIVDAQYVCALRRR